MAVVKNLMVRSGADFSQLYKEMNKAQRQLQGFKKGMNSALKGLGVALGGLAIGSFIKDATKWGSDVAEIQNVVNVTFGSMAQDIEDFSKSAMDSFGLSELAAKKYTSTMGAMLKSSGLAGEPMKELSIGLAKLTADMASFHNLPTEEVFRKIMSGMTGMTRPLKDLGINMDIANLEAYAMAQGISKSYRNMTQAEKAMLRYNYLLSVTGDMQGDFSRNAHNWAHQIKILGEQWNTLKGTLGRGFINILMPIVTWLNAIIKRIQAVAEVFRAFTVVLFGDTQASRKTGAALGYISEALGGIEDGYEDAGAAAKKAKGSVAGFDEINQLADAGAGPGGIEGLDFSNITEDAEETSGVLEKASEKARAFAEKTKGAFDTIKNTIANNKDIIAPAIGAITGALAGLAVYAGIAGLVGVFKTLGKVISSAWGILTANPLALVAIAVGALVGALIAAYKNSDQFRAVVDKLWGQVKTALTPVVEKLGEVLTWLWQNVIMPLGRIVVDVLVVAFDALVAVGQWLWQYVLEPLGGFIKDSLMPVFMAAARIIGTQLKDSVEAVISVFEFLWYSVLKPVALWLGTTFKPAFETVGQGIKDIVEGLQTTFDGLIKFITGVFTGDWKKAWDGVKQIFKGVFDSLWGIVKVPLNLIIDGINWVISGLNKLKIDIPDWVKYVPGLAGLAGKTWGISIPKIPKLAGGGIIDSPTIAMLGERGAEAVVPLENTGFVDAMASAVGTAVLSALQVSSPQTDNNGDIVIQMDGAVLGRILKPYLDREKQRIGSSAIIQPV